MTSQLASPLPESLTNPGHGHPPVSAWHHYPSLEYDPHAFAQATIAQTRQWEWDWVKINPRGVLFSELYGARYDPADYLGADVPRLIDTPYQRLEQLADLSSPTHPEVISEQEAVVRELRAGLPETPLYFTIFSPLTTVLQTVGLPITPSPVWGRGASFGIEDFWHTAPELIHGALQAALQTLIELSTRLISAGADGIFYALTGTANPLITPDKHTFDTYSTEYDRQLLESIGGRAILHTCTDTAHPEWFLGWPIQALNWDSFGRENPSLRDIAEHPSAPIVVGGVQRELFDGRHTAQIAAQVARTREELGSRPFLLTPSCALPPRFLNDTDLRAFAQAGRSNS